MRSGSIGSKKSAASIKSTEADTGGSSSWMPWGSSAQKSGDESEPKAEKPKRKFSLAKKIRFTPSTVGGDNSVVETTTEEITSVEPIAQKKNSKDVKVSPWAKLKGMAQKKEKIAVGSVEE
jgi:hypothetical protein